MHFGEIILCCGAVLCIGRYEGVRHTDIWGKSTPGRENGESKGPGAGAHLAYLRSWKRYIARVEGEGAYDEN